MGSGTTCSRGTDAMAASNAGSVTPSGLSWLSIMARRAAAKSGLGCVIKSSRSINCYMPVIHWACKAVHIARGPEVQGRVSAHGRKGGGDERRLRPAEPVDNDRPPDPRGAMAGWLHRGLQIYSPWLISAIVCYVSCRFGWKADTRLMSRVVRRRMARSASRWFHRRKPRLGNAGRLILGQQLLLASGELLAQRIHAEAGLARRGGKRDLSAYSPVGGKRTSRLKPRVRGKTAPSECKAG